MGDLGASGSAVRDARGSHRGPDELGATRSRARCASGRHAVERCPARSLHPVSLPGVCVAPSSRRRRLPVAGRAGMALHDAGEHSRVSVKMCLSLVGHFLHSVPRARARGGAGVVARARSAHTRTQRASANRKSDWSRDVLGALHRGVQAARDASSDRRARRKARRRTDAIGETRLVEPDAPQSG
jgi:hypothetical protein